MRARSLIALGIVVALVVGLGLYRTWTTPMDAGTATVSAAGATGTANDGAAASAADDVAAAAAAETPPEPGHGLPGILDFGRGQCIPCQKMMPVLDALAARHEGDIVVRYLDLGVPANQERARAMGVRLIPTQILLAADGSEAARHEGFWAQDAVEAKLQELGWTPSR